MLDAKHRIIKKIQQVYDEEEFKKDVPIIPPKHTVIKRYMINYSYEEKYKLGILTPQEYYQWQFELEEKAKAEANSKSSEKHTFWEGEDEPRQNVSDDDYQAFISQNGLDLTNVNSLSFEDIQKQALEDEVARIQAKFMPIQGDIDSLFNSIE